MKHAKQYGITLLLMLAVGLASSRAGAQIKPRDITDSDIDRAIEQDKLYLWAQMRPNFDWNGGHSNPQGGEAALVLFAMLEAGEPISSERMQNVIKAVASNEFDKNQKATYLIAFRTMALANIVAKAPDSPFAGVLKKDFDFLTRAKTPLDIGRIGAWGYRGPEAAGDNSASQLALLALWEAERARLELSESWINKIQSTWMMRHQRDGGWTYAAVGNQPSTLSMTAAGVASLYICQDLLQQQCGQPMASTAKVNAAWKFLAEKYPADLSAKADKFWRQNYLAFCLQRVGMATGAKFIGNHDWFAEGASVYAKPTPAGRSYEGDNGPIVQAAFELIFLSRGRIPLTFNKLDYGQKDSNAGWNVHPRDVARFTDFMYRNLEQRMRWQIVDINSPADQMQDAPVLFIAGDKAVDFSKEQMEKLREYALRGGTILLMPSHNAGFLESAKKLADDLFAKERDEVKLNYKLEPVLEDSPLYTRMQFRDRATFNPQNFPMDVLSDGTRPLVIISEKDLAHSWQRRATRGGQHDYEMGANLYLYTLGNEAPRRRLRPVFASSTDRPARSILNVAWLRHNGNWNTQPYALDYLSQKLTAEENRVGLKVEQGVDFTALKPEQKLAWLTGTTEFAATDADVAAVKAWLDAGGTLFINAVGGSDAFNGSAASFVDRILGGNAMLEMPAGDSPLITGKFGNEFRGLSIPEYLNDVQKNGNATVTKAARAEGGISTPFRVHIAGQRASIILARLGIQDTLDGHTAYGSKSYMPEVAREIAANVALYSAMKETKRETAPAVPASAPASQPAP